MRGSGLSFRLAQAAGFAPLLLVHGRVFPKVHWYDYLFDFGFFYDKSVDTEAWEHDTEEERELVEDGAVTAPEAFAELLPHTSCGETGREGREDCDGSRCSL